MLVGAGLMATFDATCRALTAVALVAQPAMVWLVWHLNRRHFGTPRAVVAVPAG